jgi:hypothetical protein
MAKVKLLYDNVTSEPYYREEAITGRMFRRIVGALAWPHGEMEGCALVLGEIRAPTVARHNRRHVLYVLEEKVTREPQHLVELAGRMQLDWLVRSWSTPIADARVWMIDDYNDIQRKDRKAQITIGDPAGWTAKRGEGLVPMYFALIQRRTEGEKTLFFGEGSNAVEQIKRLTEEDLSDKVIVRPSAAAAFWAVAAIDAEPLAEWGERPNHDLGPADPVGGY